MPMTEDVYHCDLCGVEEPFDNFIWLSGCFGVCEKCREKMTWEDVDAIMEYENNSKVIEAICRKYAGL